MTANGLPRARIAVVGLGLIGGSVLRRLAAGHDAVGYDADPGSRELARAAGLRVADDLATAADAGLVVLAVPMQALSTVVGQLRPLLGSDTVFTDVGSVKTPAYGVLRSAGLGDRFVGGHPMAGTERSGFAASDATLFDGAAWVLCVEPDTDLAAWLLVASVLTRLGARVVPATAAEHDTAVARISHLPHVLAAALAATAADAGPLALTLAAGSFRDGTRVAATRPDLTAQMCAANQGPLDAAVAEFVGRLTGGLDVLTAGHHARTRWQAVTGAPTERELIIDHAGLAGDLIALGREGGWVVGVDQRRLLLAVPPRV